MRSRCDKLRWAWALPLALCAGAALLVQPASAATIEKTLTDTTGAENANPIEAKRSVPTTYEFTISYVADGAPDVVILDAIPAEFTNVVVSDGGVCSELIVLKRGLGLAGATTLQCWLPAGVDASLVVTFETAQNPGRGHPQPVFAPTSCEPLLLNDGAVAAASAALPEEEIVAGPTAMLAVDVVGEACLEDHLEEPDDGDGPNGHGEVLTPASLQSGPARAEAALGAAGR
jgi:hypothetical protein